MKMQYYMLIIFDICNIQTAKTSTGTCKELLKKSTQEVDYLEQFKCYSDKLES